MDNNHLIDATKVWSSTRLPELYLPSRIRLAFPNKGKDFCPFSIPYKTSESNNTLINAENKNLQTNINSPASSLKLLTLGSPNTQSNTLEENLKVPIKSIHDVFKNVCIYIEVCSGKENRSTSLKEFISDFGPEIHNRIKKTTTHVIFKSGRLSTYVRAKTLNIPIVSLLWFEECRKELRLIEPSKFPISDIDKYENPELYNTFKRRKRNVLGLNISKNADSDSDIYLDSPLPISKTTNFTFFNQNPDLCVTPNFKEVENCNQIKDMTSLEDDLLKMKTAKKLNFDEPMTTKAIDKPKENTEYKIMTRRRSMQFTSTDQTKNINIVKISDNISEKITQRLSVNGFNSEELNNVEQKTPINQPKLQNKRRSYSVPRKETKMSLDKKIKNCEIDASVIKRNSRRNSLNLPRVSESENTLNKFTNDMKKLSRCSTNFRKNEEINITKDDVNKKIIQSNENNHSLVNVYVPPESIMEEEEEISIGKENMTSVTPTPIVNLQNEISLNTGISSSSMILNTPKQYNKSIITHNIRRTNFGVTSMMLDSSPIISAATTSNKLIRRKTLLTPCNLDETSVIERNRVVNSEKSKPRQTISNVQSKFGTPKRLLLSPECAINSSQQSTIDSYYKKNKPCTPPNNIIKSIVCVNKQTTAMATSNSNITHNVNLNVNDEGNITSATKKRKLFTQPSYTDDDLKNIIKSITPTQPRRRSIVNASSVTSATKSRRSLAPSEINKKSLGPALDMLGNSTMQINTPVIDKSKQQSKQSIEMNFQPKLLSNFLKKISETPPSKNTKYFNIPSSIVNSIEDEKVFKKLPTLVSTNMHQQQISVVKQAVKHLGGFKIEENVTGRTSHLITFERHRTFNMLRGLIRGLWILDFKWIMDSMDAGRWLHEEMYEVKDFSRAVEICRAERQAFGNNYTIDLFSLIGPIYVSEKSTIPKKNLIELIKLCSGTIVDNEIDAKYIIGDYNANNNDKIYINPLWILDSIMVNRIKKIGKYLLKENFY